jgi:hypothetical protein
MLSAPGDDPAWQDCRMSFYRRSTHPFPQHFTSVPVRLIMNHSLSLAQFSVVTLVPGSIPTCCCCCFAPSLRRIYRCCKKRQRQHPTPGGMMRIVSLTLMKPISWLFSRKHCRQMLRPYFRIRPALWVQTRLLERNHQVSRMTRI